MRKELSKLPREAVCSAVFSPCAGNFWWEIRLARPSVRKKSNMFDIFRLARQIPHCVRPLWESSWAWSMKHPIKIHGILTWLQWRRNFFSDTILNRWSHLSMPCIFIGCLIKPSSARFSRWPHTLRNLSREAKNIKHVWFYPHGLARRISHHNFPAHVRKRLSKPPREAVCSALSSSVRLAPRFFAFLYSWGEALLF